MHWHEYDVSKRCTGSSIKKTHSSDRHLKHLCNEGVRLWTKLQMSQRQLQHQQQGKEKPDLLQSKIDGWKDVEAWVVKCLAKLHDMDQCQRTSFISQEAGIGQEESSQCPLFRPNESSDQNNESNIIKIQSLWRGYCVRSKRAQAPLSPCGVSADSNLREAAVAVQSAFRGFHVRKALEAALASAKYLDQDLDDLDGLETFDFDSFIAPPPELQSSWDATPSTPRARGLRQSVPVCVESESDRATVVMPPLPLSPSLSSRHATPRTLECDEMRTPSSHLSTRDDDDASCFSTHTPGRHQNNIPAACLSPAARSKPNHSTSLHGRRLVGVSKEPARLIPKKQEQEILQDWGVQDERLAKTLLKRASRIRKLQGKVS